MWRGRIGLDLPPLQRLQNYLPGFNSWTGSKPENEDKDEKRWYHSDFPEFTIQRRYKNRVEAHESWVRGALAPESEVYRVDLSYHQTVLYTEEALSYDQWSSYYPVPYNVCLKEFGEGNMFYYYLEGNLKFKLLQFLQGSALTSTSQIKGGRVPPPLVIFKNNNEFNTFIPYLCSQYNEKSLENLCVRENFTSGSKEIDIQRLKLCRLVVKELPKWREKQSTC
jgi:hypothetical protein